ncbi:MAG TPA: PKD domain-containing protein [Flavitalea sp.]|nr:PKD domain-containing protein [Flavitalea sp.]
MFKASLKVFLVALLCIPLISAFAQTNYQPPIKWEKQFPANPAAVGQAAIGTSVLATPNNQFLVNYSTAGQVGYIMRLSSTGNLLRESAREDLLSGAFSEAFAYRNQVDRKPDSSLVFAGSGKSVLNPLEKDHAIILQKLTYNTLAANQEAYINIPGSDAAVAVCSLPDNSFAVLYKKFTEATGNVKANWDLNIARYSASGQLLFDKPITSPGNEYGTAIRYDVDGHLLISGYTDLPAGGATGTFSQNQGALPGTFVIRADLSGNFQWVKTTPEEGSLDIAATRSGNIYVLTREKNKINLQKYSRQGQVIWQKYLLNTNGQKVEEDSLTSGITALSDNNLLFYYHEKAKSASDSTYTIFQKLDGADASTIWSRRIGTKNWSVTYQVIEAPGNMLMGVGGIRGNAGDVTNDPTTYNDMRTWLYQVGPHLESTSDCAGKIDTTLTVSDPAEICSSGNVTLTAAAGLNYQWLRDGAVINNQTTNKLITSEAGLYKVILSDVSGCVDSSRAVQVTIPDPIDTTLTLSGPTSLCGSESLTISAAPGQFYQWYKDGGALQGATTQNFVATSSGIYQVVLANNNGCKDTSRAVTVSVTAAIDTTLTLSGPTELCAGGSVIITVPPNFNYVWYRNGAPLLNETTNQLLVTGTGVYFAVISAGATCSDTTRTVPVTIANPIDTAVTVSGSTALCNSQSVILSAAPGLTYQWLKDGTAIQGQTTQQLVVAAAGAYSAILKNSTGCADTSKTVVVTTVTAIDTTLQVIGETTSCAGGTVSLIAVPGLNYKWYKDGTLIAGAITNQLIVTTSGGYFAVLSAGAGCSDTTRTVPIVIATPIDTTLTISGSTALCTGQSVTLSAAAGFSYQWFKDGLSLANQTNRQYIANLAGTYEVVLKNATGCADTSRQVIVSINTAIDTTLTLSGPTNLCAGETVTMQVVANLSYAWYRNGVVIPNQSTNALIVNSSGSYFAVLNPGGICSDTTRTVDVTVGTVIDTTLTTSGPTALCTGQAVTLSAAAGFSYQWVKDGVSLPNQTARQYIANATGAYSVVLKNATGCADTSRTVAVTVNSTIDTTLTVSGSTSICSGQTVVLEAAPNFNYRWYQDGSLIAGQTTNRLAVSGSGSYYAVLTAGGGCSDTTRTVVVTVAAAIDTTVTANGPTVLCSAGSVTLSAAPGLIYQWYKDGTAIGNQTGQQYTANSSGAYSVLLSNATGCTDTSRIISVSLGGALDTSLVVSGSTVLCGGQTVVLQAAAGLTYQWYKDGIAINGAKAQQYTAGTTGAYFVALGTNGGCADSSRTVNVDVASAVDTTLLVNGATVLCNQNAVQLSAAPGLIYQWYKNGTTIQDARSQILTINTPGSYMAVLSNAVGCIDSTRLVTITNSNIDTAVVLSGPPTACTGQTVTMTAAAGFSYQWFKDRVAIANATARSYTAAVTGNYQVRLQSVQGCTDTSRTIAITISNNVIGSITPATASICNNVPVNLTASGGSVYQWYLNGTLIQNATAPVYQATQPGVYSVTIFNAGGCSASAQNTVNIQNAVLDTSISVNGPPTVCAGGSVALSGGTASAYQWLLNGSAIAGATAKQFNATVAGNYQVIVASAEGCTDTSRLVTVSIAASPTASIEAPASTVICAGTPVQLTASGGPTYSWLRDNVVIANATANVYPATLPGSYTVIVTNAGGCKDTSNAVVLAEFAKPVAGFTANAACAGAETAFTNTSTVAGNATATYRWDFGDNKTSTEKDPKHVFETSGTYNVKLVITLSTCQDAADSITKSVVIGSTGVGTRYQTVTIAAGATTTLAAREGGVTYAWSPVTGLSSPTSRVTNVTLNSSQEYTVEIAQAAGCTVVDTVLVNIQSSAGPTQFFVPTGFTPDNNGQNDVLRPMLINFRSIKYFRVFNRWGKLVYQTSTIGSGWDGRINGAPQPTETYSWTFEGEDNTGKTIKASGKSVLIR